MLRMSYLLVILACILPVIPGIAGVLPAALNYIPAIGLNELSGHGFSQAMVWSGFTTSMLLTFSSALLSCILACLMAFLILKNCWNSRFWKTIELTLSPLLAMPHVAFAIGFGFLFAPTGLGARLAEHVIPSAQTNTALPLLVQDPYAAGLTLALALKELPFLLLMSIPVLQQLKTDKVLKVSASLGYAPAAAWWKCLFPLWLRKMRFPLFAVIAYSAGVVDMALILGPTNPPTLAVQVWQWFNDPELTLLPRAAAGAVILFAITSLLLLMVWGAEHLICRRFTSWQFSGSCIFSSGKSKSALSQRAGRWLYGLVFTVSFIILPVMLLWSIAKRWRFPDLLPGRYTGQFWQDEWLAIVSTIEASLLIALTTAFLSLIAAVIAHEYRLRYRWSLPDYVIAIPMLVPQLSLLFGIQVASLALTQGSYMTLVIWSHVFFAFPFVYLALDGPWRSFDNGYIRVASSLGKSPLRAWFSVKLPLLMPALMFGWATGASVSLAQYLPTLMLGAGRVSTLTTEAVALASGYDRRVTAIYALWQALLPLLFFSFALVAARISRRRRIQTQGTASHESLPGKPHHP